ncbi:hypothetical protein [Stutzerimonas chloritidismutans]|uniref:hypothetical protein n=1 Tax=Stutzerimonas chloritidismutans TaxID=203192 RepID=UPI003F1540B7
MDNKLNGTQVWADGYSFMEVSETLITALGLRKGDATIPKAESEPHDTAIAADYDDAHTEPVGSW